MRESVAGRGRSGGGGRETRRGGDAERGRWGEGLISPSPHLPVSLSPPLRLPPSPPLRVSPSPHFVLRSPLPHNCAHAFITNLQGRKKWQIPLFVRNRMVPTWLKDQSTSMTRQETESK